MEAGAQGVVTLWGFEVFVRTQVYCTIVDKATRMNASTPHDSCPDPAFCRLQHSSVECSHLRFHWTANEAGADGIGAAMLAAIAGTGRFISVAQRVKCRCISVDPFRGLAV